MKHHICKALGSHLAFHSGDHVNNENLEMKHSSLFTILYILHILTRGGRA